VNKIIELPTTSCATSSRHHPTYVRGKSAGITIAEVIADGVVHAIGVCPGLIGVTIVVIAVNIERIEIAPILAYVIGLVTMLALSAAYNMCLARQVGSAPLRPLRNVGLGSRALAYLQLVSRTCR
jgi:predicted membrane channel-forming protein YqfA (hemolysin III family)